MARNYVYGVGFAYHLKNLNLIALPEIRRLADEVKQFTDELPANVDFPSETEALAAPSPQGISDNTFG